jgi:hypothetical protein
MDNHKKLIQEVSEKLDECLTSKGFSKVPTYWDYSITEWQRPMGWEIDRIILGHRPGRKDFFISFLVLFPQRSKKSKNPYMIFDQIQTGRLLNKPNQFFPMPSFGFLAPRFIKNTINEVNSLIDWFDKYHDVDFCIKLVLEKSGNPPETEGGKKDLNYLNKVKAQNKRSRKDKSDVKTVKTKLKQSH